MGFPTLRHCRRTVRGEARMVHGHGWVRRYVLLAVASATLGVLITRPAAADPTIPAVPDAGSRPQVPGALQLPGDDLAGGAATYPSGSIPAATVPGPLANEILQRSVAIETLSQQLL